MSAPAEPSTSDTDETNDDKSGNLLSIVHSRNSEDVVPEHADDQNKEVPEDPSDNINVSADGRKVHLDNEPLIKDVSKELTVSESQKENVTQTDVEDISETEKDIQDCNKEKSVPRNTDNYATLSVKRKLECEAKDGSLECSNVSYPLESLKKVIKSTSSASDVKSPKLDANEAVNLNMTHRELDSTQDNIVSSSTDLNQGTETCARDETSEELENPPNTPQNSVQSDDGVKKREIDLVKLYRIEKWLSGISTLEYKGSKVHQYITRKTAKLKRKFEVKDQIPGCSTAPESPCKILKSPKQNLDPTSTKPEIKQPHGIQQFLEGCGQVSVDTILETERKQDEEILYRLQGSSLDVKEISSAGANLEQHKSSGAEKHTEMSTNPDSDFDYVMPVFTCPDCGELLSRSNLESCYYHALSCFSENKSIADNDETLKQEELTDSDEYYSTTTSDSSRSTGFNSGMLHFYLEEFMRSSLQRPNASSEDYPSSLPDEQYFNCPFCLCPLNSHNLRSHIKAVHISSKFSVRDAARELAADASKHGFVRGRVFKCRKCGDKFSSREGLKLHIDTFIDGDCGPGSSSAQFSFENKDYDQSSSRTTEVIAQNVERELATANDHPSSPPPTELTEQGARLESAIESCRPGPSHCTVSMEHHKESKCKGKNEAEGCSCRNIHGDDTEHYICNCEGTAFTCRFCHYACENLDDMIDHYSIHELLRVCYKQEDKSEDRRPNHKCPNCLKEFEDLDNVIDHLNLVYRTPFTCIVCHEHFASESRYHDHLQMHTSDLFTLYQELRNQEQKIATTSTEDQDASKSTPKRRKRRSKKTQDNQKTDKSPSNLQTYHSANTKQLEILQSKLNKTTDASSDENKEVRVDSNEKSAQTDRIQKELGSSSASQQVVHSPKTKVSSTNEYCNEDDSINKSSSGENKAMDKNVQEGINILKYSVPKTQSPQSGNFCPDETSDRKEIEVEKSKKSNKESETRTSKTNSPNADRKYSSTHQLSAEEIISWEERESQENLLLLAAAASSSIPQVIDLPNKQEVIFTYASHDQEDICRQAIKGSEKNVMGQKSSSGQQISPLARTKKLASIENYDADISTGASSDDQEAVQIFSCGTSKYTKKQSSASSERSSHRCTKCNITFDSASNLVAHNLMHSIYLCLKCNERFSLKSSFLKHLAYHSGRKPYACFRCWMSFPTRIDLQIHQHLCSKRIRYS